jgi:putative addiction module component (TIGR02574 family)
MSWSAIVNASVRHLYEEALHLDFTARTALTGLLIESLDTAVLEEGVEAAWSAEIDRRIAELDSGSVAIIPWEALRARLYGGSGMERPY